MKSYLVILGNKAKGELSSSLLNQHVEYLKKMNEAGFLVLCGPFADQSGAMLVYRCDSVQIAEGLITKDPFVQEKYYGSYEIKEFAEANSENHWLMEPADTGSR